MNAPMSFQVIEPEARQIPAAELRRQIAEKVLQCSRWLRANRFEVLVVQRKLKQPRIVIKHNQVLCDALEGVVDGYERTVSGERRFRYVVRFDVMIEWEAA